MYKDMDEEYHKKQNPISNSFNPTGPSDKKTPIIRQENSDDVLKPPEPEVKLATSPNRHLNSTVGKYIEKSASND